MGTKIFVATVIYQYIHLGLDVLFSIMFQEYFYCGTSFLIGIIRLFAIHGSRDVLERTNPFRATVHIGPTFHGYIIFILDPSQVFGLFITAFPVYAKAILLILTYIEVVAAIIIHYAIFVVRRQVSQDIQRIIEVQGIRRRQQVGILICDDIVTRINQISSMAWNPDVNGPHCKICHKEYIPRSVVQGYTCGHTFHASCSTSRMFTDHTCPICNAVVLPPNNQ